MSVNGYTDSIGTDEYNQRLSLRRANAVKDYLETHRRVRQPHDREGVRRNESGGASNETAEGRAQNRRVELVVNP